jgi:predicted tellurium resistance membrane protein TerC
MFTRLQCSHKVKAGMLLQIAVIDLVFSLDSVITAVGMADHLPFIVLAIVIAAASSLTINWLSFPAVSPAAL